MSLVSDAIRRTARSATRGALPMLLGDRFDPTTTNPVAAPNVALFPRLGLAYNRVKKNANSTTVSILTELETGLLLDDSDAKRRSPHLESASWPLLRRARRFHYFVIVRNPYSRVLSAFINRFSKKRYNDEYGTFSLDASGFASFLEWLADGGLTADAHWDQQHKLIYAPLTDFDSVLKFEEFPDNLEELLRQRGIHLTDAHRNLIGNVNQMTRTKASQKMREFYTPRSEAMVTDLFKSDFDLLPYPRGVW
jgi:hypothetical protein